MKGTKSGKIKSAPLEREAQTEDGSEDCGAAAEEEDHGREPTISDLAGILQAHIGRQEAREVQWEKEIIRQDQRFKDLQHQFSLFQQEFQAQTSAGLLPGEQDHARFSAGLGPADHERPHEYADWDEVEPEPAPRCSKSGDSVSVHPSYKEPKLQKLSEEDDIEHFLITFERIACACRWPRSDWAFHLIPLLTGKARSAYVHMDVDASMDYDHVKAAILQKYEISSETYRLRFRSLQVEPNESPRELFVKLKELYGRWVRPRGKTIDEINETIILEQYFRMLSPELQVWIKERNPRDAAEAVSLADAFVAARRRNQSWAYKAMKKDYTPVPGNTSPTGNVGKPCGREKYFPSQTKKLGRKPVCYLCGKEGHTKPVCPQNPAKLSQMCFVPRGNHAPNPMNQLLVETTVEIDGQKVKALIDTGSTQSLVQRRYVSPAHICTSETIPICCVHGDEKWYPTADVYMKVQGHVYLLNVGVMDRLPFPVVLGNDLPVLTDLINDPKMCNVAITLSQLKTPREDDPSLRALPFFGAEIEAGPTREQKSRRQRKRDKFKHTTVSTLLPEPEVQLRFEIPDNILELQHQDAGLADLIKGAEEGGTAKEFCLQNGILYRQHGELKQLVVPRAARETVLSLGHSIPWAGHLGKNKTLARIQQYFYWPGLYRDVASFCRSCPQCQKTSARFAARAPLQPLLIIMTPFERLGMDVVGPVEKSKSGNRFMLVITDYATKYPEVFPLKSVKAKTVAFCLVQFFARVGFPKEILTDQGTNFMSKLLKDVYKLIGISRLRTTPYHPQTDGLTERFNQTLKNMLRKFINE
uniref:Gypsy retrotransposon integrase-like protein 1 n=1 Tax=Nothobranchius furzeri TaxID=105023 RepID=A0A8C6KQE2_NOTFU